MIEILINIFFLIIAITLLVLFYQKQSKISKLLILNNKIYQEKNILFKKYESLYNYSNDIIFLINKDLKIIEVNDSAIKAFGYTKNEYLNFNLYNLGSKHEIDLLINEFKKVDDENGVVCESELKRKNNILFPSEISIRLLKIENNSFFQVIIKDLSERKWLEEFLSLSERKYKLAIENLNEGVWVLDKDCKIIFINKKLEILLGYSDIEMLGKSIFEFVDDSVVEYFKEGIKNREKGFKGHYEFELIKKDGTRIVTKIEESPIFDENGNYIGVISGILDISYHIKNAEALKDSEERYKKLLNSLTDYIYSVKVFEGKVISTLHGLGCDAVTGYTSKEFENNPYLWYEMVYPEDKLMVKAHSDKSLTGDFKESIEHRIIHKNGSVKWIKNTPVPRINKYGIFEGYDGLIQDITERKNIEETLKHEMAFTHALLENINDGIIACNENGKITIFNHTAKEWLGLDASNILQDDWSKYFELFSIDGITPLSESFDPLLKALKEGGFSNLKMAVTSKNKPLRYVILNGYPILDDNGKKIGAVIVMRNVTEQMKAENEIINNELKYRKLFDEAPVGYQEIDKDGRIVQVNRTELEMLGYEENEMLNHYIWEFVKEKEITQEKIYSKFNGKEKPGKNFERTYIKKNGITIPVLIEDVLLRDENGKISGIRSIVQDISERKRNETALFDSNLRLEKTLVELKETQKQILQQERLRALGQMASGIAHDINNSLTPILGYADYLLSIREVVNLAAKPLNVIKTASMDIKRTIERMKEFYRPKLDTVEFRPISLNNIIKSSLEFTKHRWKDIPEADGVVIRIKTHFENDLPMIFGNESEIREALTNLIINATDAMPEGGIISFSSYSDQEKVFVEITDSGIGMDEETRQRCFDPFYTTKGEKGTGLGLSMVYGIIQRHDGTIEAESGLNKGTTFKIIFKNIGSEKKSDGISEKEYLLAPIKALCIDDDEEVRTIITTMMEVKNHKVITSNNGEAGIELFKKSIEENDPFDIVITDLGMPNMDGKAVAQKIKSLSSKTPIILMTGWGTFIEDDSIKFVDYILKKPLSLEDLNQAIAKVYDLI